MNAPLSANSVNKSRTKQSETKWNKPNHDGFTMVC